MLLNSHVSAYARCLAGKVCGLVRSTWGTSLGEGRLGARDRILNTKVACWACAGQTFPPKFICGGPERYHNGGARSRQRHYGAPQSHRCTRKRRETRPHGPSSQSLRGGTCATHTSTSSGATPARRSCRCCPKSRGRPSRRSRSRAFPTGSSLAETKWSRPKRVWLGERLRLPASACACLCLCVCVCVCNNDIACVRPLRHASCNDTDCPCQQQHNVCV